MIRIDAIRLATGQRVIQRKTHDRVRIWRMGICEVRSHLFVGRWPLNGRSHFEDGAPSENPRFSTRIIGDHKIVTHFPNEMHHVREGSVLILCSEDAPEFSVVNNVEKEIRVTCLLVGDARACLIKRMITRRRGNFWCNVLDPWLGDRIRLLIRMAVQCEMIGHRRDFGNQQRNASVAGNPADVVICCVQYLLELYKTKLPAR